MNIDYYMQKKHVFKKRQKTTIKILNHDISIFCHVYAVTRYRMDFVLIRMIRKIFRRRYIKAKIRFFKPKYWLFLLPNYILTQKSKNSRMGAGVGKFVRLTNLTHPGKSIIKTWYYDYDYVCEIVKYFRFKLRAHLLVK